MLWLLQQHALSKEIDLFQTITGTLDRGGVPWLAVRALSFTDTIVEADRVIHGLALEEIEPMVVPESQPIMVYGSYTLALIAKKRGWTPGAFITDAFTHDAWVKGWGAERMLNGHAQVGRLDSLMSMVGHLEGEVFIRPLEDTKSFSGMVLAKSEVESWATSVLKANSHTLHGETMIVVAPHQTINAEYRLFVVDGRIVTSSMYKLGTQVVYERYTPTDVLQWAGERIEQWVPDRAFVLDIAETPEGMKVIEVNNINSSGVYAADISKVIQCLDTMDF